jgi:hypothetical protein
MEQWASHFAQSFSKYIKEHGCQECDTLHNTLMVHFQYYNLTTLRTEKLSHILHFGTFYDIKEVGKCYHDSRNNDESVCKILCVVNLFSNNMQLYRDVQFSWILSQFMNMTKIIIRFPRKIEPLPMVYRNPYSWNIKPLHFLTRNLILHNIQLYRDVHFSWFISKFMNMSVFN